MRFATLLKLITPHRNILLGILGLLLVSTAVSLATPWIAGLLTGTVLGDVKEGPSAGVWLALWIGLITLRSGLNFITRYGIGSVGESLTAQMRDRLYQQMQVLPLHYYQQRRLGDTLTLLSNDAQTISTFVTNTLVQLLPALLTFSGALALMAWLNIKLTLVLALLLPAYFFAMKVIGRRLRPLSQKLVEANSHMVSVVEENLSLLPAIKAFSREAYESARFDNANTQLQSISREQLRIQSILSPVIGLLGGLGLALVVWLGITGFEDDSFSPAQLVSILMYAVLLVTPLQSFANLYGELQRVRGSSSRIIEFLGQVPEQDQDTDTTLNKVRGDIQFDNVSFQYPSRKPVLRALSLHIQAGETIAITGENGSGKTTLAHLLIRFISPTTGTLSIDGTDISGVKLSSVRAQIGLVAQHVLLLNGSIAENIAYAAPQASLEDIHQAARAAHASAFIEKLPLGYETIIGDQGIKLSGGQRQRISLARTLLKDPPILILDEATAMFDPQGEMAFIDECHNLLTKKTVILITHRPASLALADRILCLEDGKITEPARPAND